MSPLNKILQFCLKTVIELKAAQKQADSNTYVK